MLDLARYHEWNPFIVAIDHVGARPRSAARCASTCAGMTGTEARWAKEITEIVARRFAKERAALAYRFTGLPPTFGLVRAT